MDSHVATFWKDFESGAHGGYREYVLRKRFVEPSAISDLELLDSATDFFAFLKEKAEAQPLLEVLALIEAYEKGENFDEDGELFKPHFSFH